jgi:hypothetical protein
LVERHGGTVSAHSAGLGHGSEFTVRLPLSRSSDRAGDDAALTRARRALIVDHDRYELEALRRALDKADQRRPSARRLRARRCSTPS